VSKKVITEIGNPTVLINNAGVMPGKTLIDATKKDIELTFNVNILSHFWLIKEFLPDMIKHNHGMIVTVASLAAYITIPNMVEYAATKAGTLALHEGLTAELVTRYNAPKVRTVLVTPGFVNTALFQGGKNDSRFLLPTLNPGSVAEAIVAKVLAGTSGRIILPKVGQLITSFKGWSLFLQIHVRQELKNVMASFPGRK
jgi:all-trans-retinol dehydrogenase (NAD+)